MNQTIIKLYLSFFVIAVFVVGCKKAPKYYEKLHDQPELRLNYDPIYAIGDTLTLVGRLNPENDLHISIGDVQAQIIKSTKIKPTDNRSVDTTTLIDEVKILITQDMGIGPNRSLRITSAGNVTSWPGIEIIESSSKGYLKSQLELTKHSNIPSGAKPIFCQNGTGDIYLWNVDHTVTKISKDGIKTVVVSTSAWQDATDKFTVVRLNAAGVDPQENYLYFSAITTDATADNNENQIYRFCKYDLKVGTCKTLNRTILPNDPTKRIQASYKPFEGVINSVRLHDCNAIIPDRKGNVYLNIGDYATAHLSTSNDFTYIFKVLNSAHYPKIWNQQENRYYITAEINSMIPGVGTNAEPLAWAPDEGIMYGLPKVGGLNFSVFDLYNKTPIYTLPAKFSPILYGNAKPYISGSFKILSGSYEGEDGLFGYLPLPEERVLILYYQGIETQKVKPYIDQYPALGVRDFRNKIGRRYAPKKLLRNGFIMSNKDQMLNYDSDGMIYMTANEKSVIVKTNYK